MNEQETQKETTVRKSSLAPTVLVSGGAGFIGSHLTEALLLNGAKVVVLDNFSTGKKENLRGVLDNPKFSLIECDINEGIPKNIDSVDYIFHLAGLESYVYGDPNISLDSLLTNAVGTKNLLDLAKKCYAKFLLVSSIDVFEGAISSYDISHYFGKNESEEKKYSHIEAKRFAEALVWEYHKKFKINSRIVRLPEVYGPRMDFNSAGELGRLTKSLLDHTDLTVFGDGLEKNYYLYITDTVSGLVKAQFTDDSDGKIYTLINNEAITTLELTYLIKSLSNSGVQVVFKNPTDKAKDKDLKNLALEIPANLRWSPKIDLKTGITKTLKWYDYDINTHNFKPAKFLERQPKEDVNSITTIKHEEQQLSKPQEPAPRAPLIVLPKIDLKPPKINIPVKTEKIKIKTSPQPSSGRSPRSIIFGIAGAITIALFLFLILPAVQTLYFARKGFDSLIKAKENFTLLNLDEAKKESQAAEKHFIQAKGHYAKLGWVFLVSGQEKKLRTYAKLLRVSEYVSSSISNSSSGAKPLTQVWTSVKPDSKETVSKESISEASLYFKTAKEDLERAQAELKELDIGSLPPSQKSMIEDFNNQLPVLKDVLEFAHNSIESIPDILGVEGSKRYLILFQNPNELRATGGFIGSYAVASLEKGKIQAITIDDVYNVDGLLDLNKVNTPTYKPISDNLKVEYLRIRDANWNPSFPDSAKTILSLFDQANGSRFHGVLAIDIYFVQELLKATGPIYLTAYNEEITSENVYERAQYHTEASYTPGSQQKKAFLTVLGSKLLETIFSLPNEKISAMAEGTYKSLVEKHLTVFIPNNQVTALISQMGWDGRISDTTGDFIMVVDSNVGSNKSNYYISKEASYDITNKYRDGALEVTLNLKYKHSGKDDSWPGGPYKNYLRVLVPQNSFLHKATIKAQGETARDLTEDVIVGEDSKKRSFETLFIVNPGEEIELAFNYTLPPQISLGKGEKIYSLIWQKQPGTEVMPVSISFAEPFGKTVVSTEPEFKKVDETYTLKKDLRSDLDVTVQLK